MKYFKEISASQLLLWFTLSFSALTLQAATPSVSILMYHHVSEDTPRVTSVTPEEFEAHLQYLKDNDFNVVSLPDAIHAVEQGSGLPDKAVVLTFDDAYLNLYENAAPILERFEMPWTLFVSTEVIRETPTSFMSWQQLEELKSKGVTIANHSTDHAHLPRRQNGENWQQWEERIRNNLLAAQEELEQRLGIENRLIAYPFGEYNNRLRDILVDLDFHGFGQHSGAYGKYSDPQAIPRFPASGNYADLETLSVKMTALNFPTLRINFSDTLLTHSQTRPGLGITLEMDDIHQHQLQCFVGGEPVSPTWVDSNRFYIQANEDIPIGRSRYNCTTPSKAQPNRFYWFSKQWIRPDSQGSWPD